MTPPRRARLAAAPSAGSKRRVRMWAVFEVIFTERRNIGVQVGELHETRLAAENARARYLASVPGLDASRVNVSKKYVFAP